MMQFSKTKKKSGFTHSHTSESRATQPDLDLGFLWKDSEKKRKKLMEDNNKEWFISTV